LCAFGDTLSYAGEYSYWDYGFGDTLHWRLSYWRISSLETIVFEIRALAMDGRVSL